MEVAATQSFKTAWQISRRYLGTKDEITIKFFDIYSQSQKIVDAHETKKCKKETHVKHIPNTIPQDAKRTGI